MEGSTGQGNREVSRRCPGVVPGRVTGRLDQAIRRVTGRLDQAVRRVSRGIQEVS